MHKAWQKEAGIIKQGGVGVLPTDTIYGLVGSALSKKAVARIYRLRQRQPQKPMIILIGSLKDLSRFSIKLNPPSSIGRPENRRRILQKLWPGRVSIILPCPSKKLAYLHRGTKTLAFRLPAKKDLRQLLKKTGPLVAPSANPQGLKPAATIKAAKKYFGNNVDFYLDGGRLIGPPSILIQILR